MGDKFRHEGKRPTIADVARRAGVSVPTVSRVLTGAAKVSPARQELVQRAIAELGFRPSAVARALVSNERNTIGILSAETSRYGYVEMIRGIENAASAAHIGVMIRLLDEQEEKSFETSIQPMLDQPLAGVIVLPLGPGDKHVTATIPAGAPVVTVGGAWKSGSPDVSLAESKAAVELTNHLLDLGHATVHHVGVANAPRRTAGWRLALRRRGIAVPPIIESTWEPADGRLAGLRIAAMDDVTAVFCGNDEIAFGVIRGLVESGLSVPEDVSVVGFDDNPLASIWFPALTTVRQDFFGLGVQAFERLNSLQSNRSRRKPASLATPLVIRDSSGPPRPRLS